ncbi:hypothetical protein DV714_20465 [Parageobacillus thermoglucosidasius]|nr:hypothetical protein DV714_20465 [Parageobacillus thermoglucosidasius]
MVKKSKTKKAGRRAENAVFRAVFRRIDMFSPQPAAFSRRKPLFAKKSFFLDALSRKKPA